MTVLDDLIREDQENVNRFLRPLIRTFFLKPVLKRGGPRIRRSAELRP